MEPPGSTLDGLVGRQLGDFRLVDVIGAGGMGTAYRAQQITLGRDAVVKVIAATSEDAKARFLREARLASRLDHPYAAHVYAFGADDGVLWIAMELVRGIPLDRWIDDQGAIPLARFMPLFDRLCEVIYCAHEQGIIHRDIKPSNVMVVRRAGRLLPKLLDFGVARASDMIDDGSAGKARVGSPGYMAPEMWLDAKRASAQSDLYALATTGYEMLTAKRLFAGASDMQIARAHARGEIPPLGPGSPAGLERVFARALAKVAAQRYPDVLAFATAVREVARASVPDTAIDLDDAVRDQFTTGGPQPLAEALLDLAAARGPDKAWEAAWRTVDVLVRVVGVMALASRAGLGGRLDAATASSVRALVERGLAADEWIELVGRLVEPYAQTADAHPLPELVAAFASNGDARRIARQLAALRGGDADVTTAQVVIGELAKMLRACAFVTDYAWISVDDRNRAELWTGPRREPRELREVPAETTAGVWLLDRDGAPIVCISPFVHIGPPSPGADPELFVIDGPARRGARLVAWPREFERYDDTLWRFIADELAPLAATKAGADRDDAVPYRGLASFGPGDTQMFYGREREVEAVVNRLRVQSLIAVVGPSGVGKSSFVHAGVLPGLPESWQTVLLRPGPLPLAALDARLLAAGVTTSPIADQIRADPGALGRILDDAARRQGTRIVIVIDQLEEIFTQCRDVTTRDQLARALASLGDDRAQLDTRAIVTVRDDFLVRTAELPGFGARLQAGLELVTLPDPAALTRILVEPLRQVGYSFESDKMPEEMIAEVREHPGALALLSFAASKLWELRDRNFKHITRRAYASIGGVVGALAKHAEDTLASLSEAHHKLVRELFRHLVTSEGTRATLSRAEAIELLGKGPDAERVIETLVERRLVVAYEGDHKTERIEVIHEALLSAWPRLVQWQREDAEGARMRDQVRAAARQWGERGKPKGLLWRSEALVELKLWRSRHGGALTDLERAFTAASIADEQRSRRIRRIAVATVMVGLVIGLVILQRANATARDNAEASRRSELAMLVEQGRTALVGGHPQEAMVYLSAAYSRGAEDPNLGFLLGQGRRALSGQRMVLRSTSLGVKDAVFTPDGTRLVSTEIEGPIKIWDAHTGELVTTIPGVTSNRPAHIPVVLDDDRLLVFGPGTVPAIWNLRTSKKLFELPVAAGALARVNPDHSIIMTLESDHLRSWRASDGSAIGDRLITKSPGAGRALRLSNDRYAYLDNGSVSVGAVDLAAAAIAVGTVVVTGTFNITIDRDGHRVALTNGRQVIVFAVAPDAPPRVLVGHTSDIWRVEFSPDGTRLASSGNDHTAKIWDAETGAMITTLDGHDGLVSALAWSPDGNRLVTGAADHTVRVWDAYTGGALSVLYGHADRVTSAHFDRDGTQITTSANDGTAQVFDAPIAKQTIELTHEGPHTLTSRDPRKILVVGHDARAWLVDPTALKVIASFGPYADVPAAMSRYDKLNRQSYGDLDASGTRVVIPADNTAVIAQITDPDHPIKLAHPSRVTVARFAPDGRVVTGCEDGSVSVWSTTGVLDKRFSHRSDTGSHTSVEIADLVFDRDTTRFAVASGEGVKLYDLHTIEQALGHGTDLPKLISNLGLVFSHDGTWLAGAGDDTNARVADLSSGAVRFAAQGLSKMSGIALSPDDRRVIVANQEGSVTILDSANGRLLARLGESRSNGFMIGVLDQGDRVITADDTGRVRVWPIEVEARTPDEVAREVECKIPLRLQDTRLIPGVLPGRCLTHM